ncbi:hypothetical protein [Pseudomonas sp. Irchel 3E13]|uniref:hypothetical protein n=1 Tax=Pseudomonas sp. Irchel 3E13 TaxID=2008975 RepID=UPI000BA32B8C|nr:hypothetical protein [Pseudomonas sp. Irchel 3E13]
MTHDYPEYPSVLAKVDESRYMDAVGALQGVRLAFFDGVQILVPEAEVQAIAMLQSRFNAVLVYGQAKEFEFATKAQAQAVAVELVRLGQAVHSSTGQNAEDMVRSALEHPSATLLSWSALYRSTMLPL